MRKKLLFTALLMLMSICMAQAQTGPADNEIWYEGEDIDFSEQSWINDAASQVDLFGAELDNIDYDNHILYFKSDVTKIGGEPFAYLTELTGITLPEKVETIDTYAFSGSGLISIIIPNSVTSIGEGAFFDCPNLASVVLPEGLMTIEPSTFQTCPSLISINIPNTVTSIGANAFDSDTSLPYIIIPNSVTEIGANAFYLCENAKYIIIPSSVTNIGDYAFWTCNDNMEYISVAWKDLTELFCGDNIIYYDTMSEPSEYSPTIYVPTDTKTMYDESSPWGDGYYENVEKADVTYSNGTNHSADVEDAITIDDTYQNFNSFRQKTDIDITYTRTFNNNNWQALYVPFAIPMESLENFEVAQMTGKSASSNNVVISRITSGTLSANTPYFIKLKSGQEASQSIFVEDATLEPTNACGHTSGDYTLTGIYSRMTGVELKAAGDPYALSGGEFKQANDAAILGAFRFYLTGVPSSGKIDIEFADAPTGVESLSPALSSKEGEIFNLQGIRVNENYKGIVIVDGKKYLLK